MFTIMKMKFLFSAMALLLIAPSLSAQITTGNPTAKVIRTGNRAQEGDWGIYMGATTSMFKDISDSGIDVSALPLLNFKYMKSDELEYRVGLKIYRAKEKMSGEDASDVDFKAKGLTSEYMLSPGLAYHFNKTNLLDVYGGFELPFGMEHERYIEEYDKDELTKTRAQFKVGLGAFIGLQAYLGNLPVALGVEYGISSMFTAGKKYKVDNGDDTFYFSTDDPNLTTAFKELHSSDSKVGNEVRITLSYFFK